MCSLIALYCLCCFIVLYKPPQDFPTLVDTCESTRGLAGPDEPCTSVLSLAPFRSAGLWWRVKCTRHLVLGRKKAFLERLYVLNFLTLPGYGCQWAGMGETTLLPRPKTPRRLALAILAPPRGFEPLPEDTGIFKICRLVTGLEPVFCDPHTFCSLTRPLQ